MDGGPDPTEGQSLPRPKDRHGRFKLRRVTSKKKMRAKLKSVKTEGSVR